MSKLFFVLLFLLSLTFSFVHLGKWALMDFDEATYAKVQYESSQQTDVITLRSANKPWFEKPPLYFWLSRGSTALFSETEFALRFPSALLTAVSILLVYFIVLELTKDSMAALMSGAVLLTTAYFLFAGRQMRLDIPVTASILLAFYGFLKARTEQKWFLIFGLGVAIGVLFKSVIGLLVYPILILFSILYRDFTWLKNKWFWFGNFFAFLLLLPWHYYESVHFGKSFWESYLFLSVFKRATEVVTPGATPPFFYHFLQLFVVTQPWFLVFFGLIALFAYHARGKLQNYKVELFSLLSSIFILILFYIPQTRLLYYFIPLLPFMAMFIGAFFARLLLNNKNVVLAIFVILVCVAGTHTALRIFSPKERGFYLQHTNKLSRYEVAEDEKAVATAAVDENLPLYTYRWQFFPTILYYSSIQGGLRIFEVTSGTVNMPFLLLLPTPALSQSLPLKIEEGTKAQVMYKGEAATLLKIFK